LGKGVRGGYFGDLGWVDFGGGERKVPISHKRFRRGKRDVAIVYRRNTQPKVSSQNNHSKPDYYQHAANIIRRKEGEWGVLGIADV
jgi:hypothetical protein